jgi:hypothetical protein
MAKPLDKTPPSSSAARLLDPSVVARATVPVKTSFPQNTAGGTAPPETARALTKREFILDDDSDQALIELLRVIREGTGTRLSASQVLRALIWSVLPMSESLLLHLSNSGPWKLPGNGVEADAARAAFHLRLVEAIRSSLATVLTR